MKVLIACEESGIVTEAFRKRGHNAWSCDLLPTSGNHPEWHIQDDVLKHLNDGWDMMIAHPPCTYLTVTANRWLKDQPPRESGNLVGEERRKAQEEAISFFKSLYNAPIDKIVIENPIGIMSSVLRKPDQIIHPFYFGDPISKATCLWLKNVPLLYHFKDDTIFSKRTWVEPEWYTTKTGNRYPKWSMIDACKIKDLKERSQYRSKTFPGIANAMAEQWG
jgi:hypothetical protein